VKVGGFDFELPERLIAQEPAVPRDASRMLVLDRDTGQVAHRSFTDLPGELRAGDLVVINDTKVFPARLRGTKPTGGRVEILLVERVGGASGRSVWRAMIDGSRSLRAGMTLSCAGELLIELMEREKAMWHVRLIHEGSELEPLLESIGEVPLPPYIRRDAADVRRDADRERYQTIFARSSGAIAAPTAGLHLTAGVLDALRERGWRRRP
jgi:S-adenosylmethionine:tRNA ribosyltransferase-isomerase